MNGNIVSYQFHAFISRAYNAVSDEVMEWVESCWAEKLNHSVDCASNITDLRVSEIWKFIYSQTLDPLEFSHQSKLFLKVLQFGQRININSARELWEVLNIKKFGNETDLSSHDQCILQVKIFLLGIYQDLITENIPHRSAQDKFVAFCDTLYISGLSAFATERKWLEFRFDIMSKISKTPNPNYGSIVLGAFGRHFLNQESIPTWNDISSWILQMSSFVESFGILLLANSCVTILHPSECEFLKLAVTDSKAWNVTEAQKSKYHELVANLFEQETNHGKQNGILNMMVENMTKLEDFSFLTEEEMRYAEKMTISEVKFLLANNNPKDWKAKLRQKSLDVAFIQVIFLKNLETPKLSL